MSRLILFVVLATFIAACYSLNAAQIKESITQTNSWQFLGLGGRYGYMKSIVSKQKIIESDHFPPKSMYKYAKSSQIQNLKDDDKAAVSIRYAHHRPLITTNRPASKTTQKDLIDDLQRSFETGNYYKAISDNIKWYKLNPDHEGNARTRFDTYIKEGIKDALEVHVINGLITDTQKKQLVIEHDLDTKHPEFNVILNSDLRDEARRLIIKNTDEYRTKVG